MALPDIVDCLGLRPYPLKESLLEYLEELRERKVEEDTLAAQTPSPSDTPASNSTEQQQGSNTNAASSSSDASTTVNKDSEKNEDKDLKQ